MNPVNKAQVGDFASREGLKERSESELFELYSIYSVLSGGLGETVNAIDAHLAGSEFGVDGVAILVQGRLVVDNTDVEQAITDIKNPSIDFYFFSLRPVLHLIMETFLNFSILLPDSSMDL